MSGRSAPLAPVLLRPRLEVLAPAIHSLWSRLRPRAGEDAPLRLAFTACSVGEGTTTVALCAAVGLALHGGQSVVLVGADGERPGLARLLGCDPGIGLPEVLAGSLSPETALLATDVPGLHLLSCARTNSATAGDAHAAGAEPEPTRAPSDGGAGAVWTSPDAQLRRLWDRLGRNGRHVLVDAPAVTPSSEGTPWLESLDEVVLVVSAGRTRSRDALRVVARWRERGPRLRGVVLNRAAD